MKAFAAALCFIATPTFAAETISAESISIEVQLDAAALAKLQSLDEAVVISGWFAGQPAAGNTLPLDDLGMVWLAIDAITIRPQASVKVSMGSGLAASPLSAVTATWLNVNVYSARFAAEDNLLDCSLVDGPVADLAKTPQVVTCTLIED